MKHVVIAMQELLTKTLQLGNSQLELTTDTPLLGAIPEFDSMAIVSVITAIEDQFGITIDDDEITADIFATLGSLSEFIQTKLN